MSEIVSPLSQEELAQLTGAFEALEANRDEAHVEAVFRLLDRNGNGLLSKEEIRVVINQMSSNGFSDADAQGFIEALDKNGDGQVDIREFIDHINNL